jgi:hypothetical protein
LQNMDFVFLHRPSPTNETKSLYRSSFSFVTGRTEFRFTFLERKLSAKR